MKRTGIKDHAICLSFQKQKRAKKRNEENMRIRDGLDIWDIPKKAYFQQET